jgi:hypothetical protein
MFNKKEINTQKIVKNILKETKNNKNKLLIEQDIVTTRIMRIVESTENIKKYHLLSERKKKKIAYSIVKEIILLSNKGILNEQLADHLNKLFGNSFVNMANTVVEPLINSITRDLGLPDYFKKFVVSHLTSNPTELIKSLKDCDSFTETISNSLSESLSMMIQQQKALTGEFGTFFIKNLGDTVKEISFVDKIKDFIREKVCSSFDKFSKNAEEVLGKLKGAGLDPTTVGQ